MKMANVVSIRDLAPANVAADEDGAAYSALTSALRRYPHLEPAERQELLRFVKRASRSELRIAFLSRGLEARLFAFKKDHAGELRRGLAAWTPFIGGLLLLTILLGSFA